MNIDTDFEKYQKAKKEVEEIKDFYFHLLIYVLTIGSLIFINLKYSPEYLWFYWTAISWGIGLFFHAGKAFNWFPFFGKDWEQKKIQQFIEEEKKQSIKYQ
ncbi:putative membrane channel-forming protein YqfA (hemolysin III family) [Flavobacterium sp. PL11]|uniref:2TM domain-containing protein n=1 Tax=Flavobacterium sp. PL11 TaxID=3071717 RepID=UPI002E054DA6|nr:putative membrane channel-forming protein YqfA (hemolysin III family) [Flavobacterium sp. PL11]